jgi:hypothetical protein
MQLLGAHPQILAYQPLGCDPGLGEYWMTVVHNLSQPEHYFWQLDIFLSCHPGLGNDVESVYSVERAAEVRVLCHPRVRAAPVDLGIRLCSFNSV